MILCGLDQEDAETIATEIFLDELQSALDVWDGYLADAFKTLSGLTVAQGQLRLLPAQKNRIKAFIQWVKDMVRTGIDPATLPFPVDETAGYCVKPRRIRFMSTRLIRSAARRSPKNLVQTCTGKIGRRCLRTI